MDRTGRCALGEREDMGMGSEPADEVGERIGVTKAGARGGL